MISKEKIFIGVAWPYANGPQHIGHIAGVYLPADIYARYQRLRGLDVLMVSGSDAHGTPITLTAEKEGISNEEVVSRNHSLFIESYKALGFSFDLYTNTNTQCHWDTSQAMFIKHYESKFLDVRMQEQLYDPVSQRFLPDRYVEGECPKCGFSHARGDQCDSCGATFNSVELKKPRYSLNNEHKLEIRKTEHFFFRLSQLQPSLLKYLKQHKNHWRSHVLNFSIGQVENNYLEDRAVTRDIEWGVQVPLKKYETKCLYVWYEAVIGYLSASKEWSQLIGSSDTWQKWWCIDSNIDVKATYFLGKDNIIFHSLLWPAFLIAHGGLTLPYNIAANHHLNSYGEKFSKSRGIIISVQDCLKNFQPDMIRYALTAMAPETADTDFTWEEFENRINNELVANWGNLVQRSLTFAYRKMNKAIPACGVLTDIDKNLLDNVRAGFGEAGILYDQIKLKAALQVVRDLTSLVNQYLNNTAPWSVFKSEPERANTILYVTLQAIDWLKIMWYPILPFSCERLHHMLGYKTTIAGKIYSEIVTDSRGEHEVLRYDHDSASGVWEPSTLLSGQIMMDPQILFPKIEVPLSS
jgi:methionyl-tRNA synthetase